MQNRKFQFGPVALSNTLTTDILNPNVTSLAGPVGFTMPPAYILINNFHVTNTTVGALTFTLYKNASGVNTAGKELFVAQAVAANASYDWNGPAERIDVGDFLVGGGSALGLTISGRGEIGLA